MNNQNSASILLVIGLFVLFAPNDLQIILPTNYTNLDSHTKKIIGWSILLLSYYFYNNEKLI